MSLQQRLMPIIAKQLGQFLGPRNKMPKPVMSPQDLAKVSVEVSKRISVKNKGRFLLRCTASWEARRWSPRRYLRTFRKLSVAWTR